MGQEPEQGAAPQKKDSIVHKKYEEVPKVRQRGDGHRDVPG